VDSEHIQARNAENPTVPSPEMNVTTDATIEEQIGPPPIDPSTLDATKIEQHTVVTATTESSTKRFVVWRKTPAYLIIGCLVAGVVLMFAAFWVQSHESGQAIDRLTSQLVEARDELSASNSEIAQRETCRLRYQSAIAQAQAAVLIAFSRAVGITDTGLRDQLISEINEAGDDLSAALDARESYERDDAPLPCPI
jgi:hypothetical protein